jgi:replicative DNA helicase
VFESGISTLDSYIQHFKGGELVTVSGFTGEGKTTLLRTITKNAASEKHLGCWFTYEEPPQEFFKKFPDGLPVFCMPRELKESSLSWIDERVHEAVLKMDGLGLKFVCIDHLHYLVPMDVNIGNMSTLIGGVCRRLKQMALTYNVVIFLVAHTGKPSKEGGPPTLADIRDSSFVSQESDTVLFVYRKGDNKSSVIISKNRAYGIRQQKVHLEMQGGFLEDDYIANMGE